MHDLQNIQCLQNIHNYMKLHEVALSCKVAVMGSRCSVALCKTNNESVKRKNVSHGRRLNISPAGTQERNIWLGKQNTIVNVLVDKNGRPSKCMCVRDIGHPIFRTNHKEGHNMPIDPPSIFDSPVSTH